MRHDPDWNLMARYFAGEADAGEKTKAEAWLEANPKDARMMAALRDRRGRAPVDSEAALRAVKSRARPRLSRVTVSALAAAAVIVVAVGILLARLPRDADMPVPTFSFRTGVGERDSLVLEDGSVVLLGPMSTASATGRTVRLSGTALFRARHDEERPFTVLVGQTMVRDLGTVFTVEGDSTTSVRVSVSEGRVELSRAGVRVTLDPGDVGIATADGAVRADRGQLVAGDTSWRSGALMFSDQPLSEVARDLYDWYGVRLQVSDTVIAGRRFTGSFLATEPIARVLDVLGLAIGARIERRGDTAFVAPAPVR